MMERSPIQEPAVRTFLRRFLFTLAALGAVLALFHLVENVRGRRAWEARKAAQEALGMRYDLASYAPPPVADADNFALAPCLAAAVAGRSDAESWTLPGVFVDAATAGDWKAGRQLDPGAGAEVRKGQDLEAFLAPFDTRLEALAEAARRPGCRLPIDYGQPEVVPALLAMRARMRVLRLRALARLQAGRGEAALEDVLTGLRMVQHLQREPHLISQLLRAAWAGMVLQPVWEGLQGRVWNDAQLARLEAALAPLDLLGSLRLAWRYERAMALTSLGRAAQDPGLLPTLMQTEAPAPGRGRRLAFAATVPKGWVAQNQAALDRLYAEGLDGPIDVAGHRIDARAVDRCTAALQVRRSPYTFVALMMVPALSGQQSRVARIASGLDQARVACALERCRLARKAYPETLPELAPAFLPQVPHDLVTGAPLRYARTGEGFRLHSVGWNGTDEGGSRAKEPTAGDWVWSSGEPRPPVLRRGAGPR